MPEPKKEPKVDEVEIPKIDFGEEPKKEPKVDEVEIPKKEPKEEPKENMSLEERFKKLEESLNIETIKATVRKEIENENLANELAKYKESLSDDIKNNIKENMKLDIDKIDFTVLKSIVGLLSNGTQERISSKTDDDLNIKPSKSNDEAFSNIINNLKKKRRR